MEDYTPPLDEIQQLFILEFSIVNHAFYACSVIVGAELKASYS